MLEKKEKKRKYFIRVMLVMNGKEKITSQNIQEIT